MISLNPVPLYLFIKNKTDYIVWLGFSAGFQHRATEVRRALSTPKNVTSEGY